MKRRGFLGLIASLFGVGMVGSGKLLASAESGTANAPIVCPPMVWGDGTRQVEARGRYFAVKADESGQPWCYPMSQSEVGCPAAAIRRHECVDGRWAVTRKDLSVAWDSDDAVAWENNLYYWRVQLRDLCLLYMAGSDYVEERHLDIAQEKFFKTGKLFDEAMQRVPSQRIFLPNTVNPDIIGSVNQ